MPVRAAAVLLACALLAGCSGSRRGVSPSERAAETAAAQVGKPYRFGGSEPKSGFDCSGLVYFSYAAAGRSVPRSTQLLLKASKKISRSKLRRGDLVFFDQEGKRSSHVGLYLGDGEFVHAPSSGGRVRREKLDAAHWRKAFAGARRL